MKLAEGVLDKMRLLAKLFELGSFFPKRVNWGVAEEGRSGQYVAVDRVKQCWPQDGGIFTKR